MRTLFLLAGLVLAMPSHAETAPTVQTLLDRHAMAVGPIDRMQTRRIKLHITGAAPFDLPVVVQARRPNLIRKDVHIQDNVQVTAYDGKRAWKTDPFVPGGATPATLSPEETRALLDEADFDGALIKPESKGVKVAYAGRAKVDGKDAYELRVTLPSGAAATVWLDGTTYLEAKRSQMLPVMGRMQKVDTRIMDHRAVQGIKVPYRMESGVSGAAQKVAILVDSVEFDPKIDNAVFEKP